MPNPYYSELLKPARTIPNYGTCNDWSAEQTERAEVKNSQDGELVPDASLVSRAGAITIPEEVKHSTNLVIGTSLGALGVSPVVLEEAVTTTARALSKFFKKVTGRSSTDAPSEETSNSYN